MAEFGRTWRAGASGTKINRQNAPRARAGARLGGGPAAPIEAFEVAFADDDYEQRLELTVPFEACHRSGDSPPTRANATSPGSGGGPRIKPGGITKTSVTIDFGAFGEQVGVLVVDVEGRSR